IGIGPDGAVANFGVGSISLETGQYEEALPPLKTVIGNNKNYSAAYHLLGNVYEKLSRNEEAVEIYRQGIAAASKKGDLMPLNKMQTRMNQILHTES
ncbi:MAG: aminomethyltransferase, partial [Nitrospinae bacterium]|nr:aminomethyltransferase [Nitrospinota bacterium]